jgi:hypothetical protein
MLSAAKHLHDECYRMSRVEMLSTAKYDRNGRDRKRHEPPIKQHSEAQG